VRRNRCRWHRRDGVQGPSQAALADAQDHAGGGEIHPQGVQRAEVSKQGGVRTLGIPALGMIDPASASAAHADIRGGFLHVVMGLEKFFDRLHHELSLPRVKRLVNKPAWICAVKKASITVDDGPVEARHWYSFLVNAHPAFVGIHGDPRIGVDRPCRLSTRLHCGGEDGKGQFRRYGVCI